MTNRPGRMQRPQETARGRGISGVFADFATLTAKYSGRPAVFLSAIVLIAIWAASGPLLGFSDTWQLIVNTISSVITFVMVFIIQNTQSRDNEAIHAKLDALVQALRDADNRVIGIEQMTDEEIEDYRKREGPSPERARSDAE